MRTVQKPFLPSDRDTDRPDNGLLRAIVARARAVIDGGDSVPAKTVTRGATTPASTTGWGEALTGVSVSDAFAVLGPPCAARPLFDRCSARLEFGRSAAVTVPSIVVKPSNGDGFTAEGEPIKIRQLLVRGPQLKPYKLPLGVVFRPRCFRRRRQSRSSSWRCPSNWPRNWTSHFST